MTKRKLPSKPSRLGILLYRFSAVPGLYPLNLARRLYPDEREIALPGLPAALSGLRVGYASDIHYGHYLDKARLEDLAEKLNALDADLLILGGDYGEDSQTSLAFWRDVPDLRARLGVFAVPGNHDLTGISAAQLAKAMRRRGVTPLINALVPLRYGGCRFAVCATDDSHMGYPDYARVARLAAAEHFVIYAPHSPDALTEAYRASPKPFFDLALCGHTHGGQIALFGIAPHVSSRYGWRYGNRYRSGLIREKGTAVFISNGVGASLLPVRLGVPPQYHLLTLKATEEKT